MAYYAHTKEDPATRTILPKTEWQLLKDHLEQVAKLAEERAVKFGAAKMGKILGLAHDLGKYSQDFQDRLEEKKLKVDHATAGAQEIYRRYPSSVGKALAYCVAGHHGGLPNGNKGSPLSLPSRLNKKDLPDYCAFAEEIKIPQLVASDLADAPRASNASMYAFSMSFLVRMLYSCLVDADYLDTEKAMNPSKFSARPEKVPMTALLAKMDKKVEELTTRNRDNPSVLNEARQKILERCLVMSEALSPCFFTLTVPTGGGKTYSSLAFALKHAVKYDKERIIYVIPYTSIIEQNTQVFREVLEDMTQLENVVLEHHSNFEYPETGFNTWEPREKSHRLASENWDMPVVVTTAVQFFESLFAHKGSRCRKLHNMVNSVIILDEAQLMPIEFMKPCLLALSELVLNYKATIVFCTATQPAINHLLPGNLKPVEIMADPRQLQQIFKRVQVVYRGYMSDEEVAEEMARERQVLTIVNTRRHARLLFDCMMEQVQDDKNGCYHLSARMCPAHRKEVLKEIRETLAAEQICRVVSTQLIEAGVDVDFPAVFRAAAGIDSIAQAAGRCNREGRLCDAEGKKVYGKVIVFDPEEHGMPSKGRFSALAAITRSLFRRSADFENGLLSLEAIEAFFEQLFDLEKDSLDAQGILKLIDEGREQLAIPFATIGQAFQFIDNATISVVVPYNEDALNLMAEAETHPYPASMVRRLQPYTIQIYNYEFEALRKQKAIRIVDDFLFFVTDKSFYDQQFGLKDAQEVKSPSETLMF